MSRQTMVKFAILILPFLLLVFFAFAEKLGIRITTIGVLFMKADRTPEVSIITMIILFS